MRPFLLLLLFLLTLTGYAQTATPLRVPPKALSRLAHLKELTQQEAAERRRDGKLTAELRPALNRELLASLDDFARVTAAQPTKEAYLACIDAGLSRLGPLTRDAKDRQVVAEFYQALMDIVGLDSSEGRLTAFFNQAGPSSLTAVK